MHEAEASLVAVAQAHAEAFASVVRRSRVTPD
jgi:hypothetical protein